MCKGYLSVNILRVDGFPDTTNDGVTAPLNSARKMMLIPADGGNYSSQYADELLERGEAFLFPAFKTTDYENARSVAPKDKCIYSLESDWQEWVLKNKDKFKLNDVKALLKSYIGFCKGKNKKNAQSDLFV